MDNNVEVFARQVVKAAGRNLESFIVYGSAVTGERYKNSDFNTLIILRKTDAQLLLQLSDVFRKWTSKGNPMPLIFGYDRILKSDDVFPMEFLDIKENHKILYGRDVFKNIRIRTRNIRLELEKELKNFILKLRQAYISTSGREKQVKKLMVSSISTLTALLKGLIRLHGKKAPSLKRHVIDDIPSKVRIDKAVFYKILTLKEGSDSINKHEVNEVFNDYMKEIMKIADTVDRFK